MPKTPATAPGWPHTLGLIGKYKSTEIANALLELAFLLESRGVCVIIDEATALALKARGKAIPWETLPLTEFGAHVDVAIVLGGDGTMLSSARQLAPHHVPIIGVNQGKLGFMTDIACHSLSALVNDLLSGRFSAKQRFLLEGEIWRNENCVAQNIALNDIVISRAGGRLIELSLFIDQEFISTQNGDGLIISTPTGSTAYAMAAGGPILHPGLNGIALVPLCAHTLSNRPLIISGSARIEIQIPARQAESNVHFDGQISLPLQPNDCIKIQRSPHTVSFLHPPAYSYFAMLRQKLNWSGKLSDS